MNRNRLVGAIAPSLVLAALSSACTVDAPSAEDEVATESAPLVTVPPPSGLRRPTVAGTLPNVPAAVSPAAALVPDSIHTGFVRRAGAGVTSLGGYAVSSCASYAFDAALGPGTMMVDFRHTAAAIDRDACSGAGCGVFPGFVLYARTTAGAWTRIRSFPGSTAADIFQRQSAYLVDSAREFALCRGGATADDNNVELRGVAFDPRVSRVANGIFDKTRTRTAWRADLPASFVCRTDLPVPPNFDVPREEPARSAALAVLLDYNQRLSSITDGFLRSTTMNAESAACAMHWLDTWAQRGLMTETEFSHPLQSHYDLSPYAASFTLHFAAVAADSTSTAERARVQTWLRAVANETRAFTYVREQDPGGLNNLFAWMALHLVVAGTVLDDSQLFDRGVYAFDRAIEQIRPDGLLALELLRIKDFKSFWYHNYALRPLMMAAEVARTRGVDLYAHGNGAVARAGRRLLSAYVDFSTFPDYQRQVAESTPSYIVSSNNAQLDWLEIYHRRFGATDGRGAAILTRARTRSGGALFPRLGPTSTYAFGSRL